MDSTTNLKQQIGPASRPPHLLRFVHPTVHQEIGRPFGDRGANLSIRLGSARRLPNTAIATLEAIRLFLFVERTAFVIGADEVMIEHSVREHFPDLPPSSGPASYARNYLEKLIQVPFRISAAASFRPTISTLSREGFRN
ncbi:MAG: hypothetical protein QOF70_2706 [Acetobacteraceae bacterium]|nr:hypothetical protein [Acetobacteraceae bacterium]